MKDILEIERKFVELSSKCRIENKCNCEKYNLIENSIQNIKLISNNHQEFYFSTFDRISKSIDEILNSCEMLNPSDSNNEIKNKYSSFKNTDILYIDGNENKIKIMNTLLSTFFDSVDVSNNYEFLLDSTNNIPYKVIMIDFNSFDLNKKETLFILEKLLEKEIILYVFCNYCKVCKNKECNQIVRNKNIRYFELPFEFNDLLNILSLDLEVLDFDKQ